MPNNPGMPNMGDMKANGSIPGWGGMAGGSPAATPGVGGTATPVTPTLNTNNFGGSSLATAQTTTGTINPTLNTNNFGGGTRIVSPTPNTNNFGSSPMPTATTVTGTPVSWEEGKAPDWTTTTPTPSQIGPTIYGPNGDMGLGAWQKKQAADFNSAQLEGQKSWNDAAVANGGLLGTANPYDNFVNNPATPGKASSAMTYATPAQYAQVEAMARRDAAAKQAASTLDTSSLATGNTFAGQSDPAYQRNQLQFLLKALQNYGAGGQNRFGNGFSPIFAGGRQNGSLLNGLGNRAGNAGGYQSGNNGQSSGFGLAQLLPLLMGLAQNNESMSQQQGTYGNLGMQNQTTIRPPQDYSQQDFDTFNTY